LCKVQELQIARKLFPLLFCIASLDMQASHKRPIVVPPDVLARIRGAHTIFVSNAGEDATLSNNKNAINTAYREMYQALAGWPGVQLVDAPAHADLIFQVQSTETVEYEGGSPFPTPHHPTGNETYDVSATLYLKILDTSTQQILWDNEAPMRPGTFGNNSAFAKGVKEILAPIEPTKPAPHPVNKPAPLPSQLKNPTKLLIQLTPASANSDVSDTGAAVSQALLKSGKYTLAGSANEADVVLLLYVEANIHTPPLNYMTVEVLDPGSKTIIWNFTTPFVNNYKMTAQQQINETIPYFLKAWNGVSGKDHI
jgi:hypothetical protein